MKLDEMYVKVNTTEIDLANEKMKVLNEQMEKYIKLQQRSNSMPGPMSNTGMTECVGREIKININPNKPFNPTMNESKSGGGSISYQSYVEGKQCQR